MTKKEHNDLITALQLLNLIIYREKITERTKFNLEKVISILENLERKGGVK